MTRVPEDAWLDDAYEQTQGGLGRAESESLRTAEDGPADDLDPTDPDVQAWMEGDELRWE